MSILSVDFHTHILPGIDDGCHDVDEALKVLQMEQKQGVKKIFLTPHFNAHEDFPEVFIKNRRDSLDALISAAGDKSTLPELILGAEVCFCPGMSSWDQLSELTLGNTKYILIEMPNSVWSDETYQELVNIHMKQGLVPVLAHIERYFLPFKTNSMLQKLMRLPVLLQVNCDFLLEPKTHRIAKRLLKKSFIPLIGTDCHSASWRAPNIERTRNEIMKFADETLIEKIKNTEDIVFSNQ